MVFYVPLSFRRLVILPDIKKCPEFMMDLDEAAETAERYVSYR